MTCKFSHEGWEMEIDVPEVVFEMDRASHKFKKITLLFGDDTAESPGGDRQYDDSRTGKIR